MAKHAKGPYSDSSQQDFSDFNHPTHSQGEVGFSGYGGSGCSQGKTDVSGYTVPSYPENGMDSSSLYPQNDQGFLYASDQFSYGNDSASFSAERYTSDGERIIRRKHRRRSRAPKIIASVVAVLVVVCVGCSVALANSAISLKSQASTALSQINAVQSSIESRDFSSASSSARQLQSVASQMNQELSSPLWAAASVLPVVGSDIQGVRTIVSVLDEASANALVPLTAALQQTPMDDLVTDGTIDVASLSVLLTAIEDAAPAMQSCTEKLDALPDMNIQQLQTVIGPAKEKLSGVNDSFQAAAGIAPIAADLLGANGDRTYFLAAENSAELRASGGFPGSVGTLSISNGHISLGGFTTVYDMLNEDTSSSIAITDEEKTLFYGYTRYSWDNSYNPDFSRVGEIWAASYNERHNTHIDGVVSISPSIVQKLLSALKTSVTLSDGTELNGSNATKVLEHDLYWKYLSKQATVSSSSGAKITDALFSEAAGLAFDKVLNNFDSNTLTKLSGVLVEGMGDREVMVWMSDSSEQAAMENIGATGSLDASTQQQPTLGVFSNIWLASKLGWWLGIDTKIGAAQTSSDGTRTYHVTTTLSNYLTSDEIANGGSYIMSILDSSGRIDPFVYFYAPAGGKIENIKASNGAQLTQAEYKGLQVFYSANVGSDYNAAYPNFPLGAGEEVTVTYDVVLPAGVSGDLQLTEVPTLQQYR